MGHDWCLCWMLPSHGALQKNAVVHISHAWLKITDKENCEVVAKIQKKVEE